MALLALQGVEKSFGDRKLLRGVSLVLQEGDRVGLDGANGSGKSTLVRMLAGVEPPDAGKRVMRRGLALGYLEQEPKLRGESTVREALHASMDARAAVLAEITALHDELVLEGLAPERLQSLLARQARAEERLELLGGHDVEHRIDAILAELGVGDPDRRCESLSGGEARRVALARLLLSGPDLLLLDEPTNHLDAFAIDWLEDWLLDHDLPLLLVTHDRYFLDRIVTRIVELERGDLHVHPGNYSACVVARAERIEAEGKRESARLNLLRRETAWMRRGPPARTTKAKARIRSYHELLAAAPEPESRELAFEIPPGPRLGDRVLRMQGVGHSLGGRKLIRDLDLELDPHERLGIVGPNGAGKSTFLRLCTGELIPDSGRILRGESLVFSCIDQRRSDLDPSRSVMQEIAGKNDYVQVGERAVRIESFLDGFLFPGPRKHELVGNLSGGEKSRVLLAKLLCAGGNMLILDEPTNDLDLTTLQALEEAIVAFAGAALIVSHDRWFLDRVTTRILYLDGRGGVEVHHGELADLLARVARERSAEHAAQRERVAPGRAPPRAPAPECKKRHPPWEAKELDALPDRIAAAEAELASLDAALADPKVYTRPVEELRRLQSQRETAQRQVSELFARWEELESLG